MEDRLRPPRRHVHPLHGRGGARAGLLPTSLYYSLVLYPSRTKRYLVLKL